MGRRHRRRAGQPIDISTTSAPRDHQARVKVTDDVWRDFRLVAAYRSVAVALGDRVTGAVERYRADRLRAGHADDRELLAALDRARELYDDVGAIVARPEQRADAAERRRADARAGGC